MFELFNTIFKYKEKKSPDKLGLYPEAIHTKAMPERRYLWSSRLLVILAALSICFNISLASTIYLILPQKNARPLLYRQSQTFNQLNLQEPHEKPVAAVDLLTESFIEEYVLMRHIITSDYDEMNERWGRNSRLYWTTERKLYGAFVSTEVEKNLALYRYNNIKRIVEIEWIKPLSRGFWQTQFFTLDYYPENPTPKINIWRAYVRATMLPIPYENRSLREKNPFGFLVTNYVLSYAGTPTSVQSYLNMAKKARLQQQEY